MEVITQFLSLLTVIVLSLFTLAFVSYLIGRMFGAGVGKSLTNKRKGEMKHETK